MANQPSKIPSKEQLLIAIQNETHKFQNCYTWLEKAMPANFFEEMSHDNLMLIAHSLMGFVLQDYFSMIHLKNAAIVLCLDSADADLRILKNYAMYGIKSYQAFISKTPPPFEKVQSNLRICLIHFTEAVESPDKSPLFENRTEVFALVKERNPELTQETFDKLIEKLDVSFLRSLSLERLALAFDMYSRATTRDNCQYEVRYNEDWQSLQTPSMQIVLAWRNAPKYNFLYQMARVIHRHGLIMKKVLATYVDPFSKGSIFIMAMELHGSNGKAAWDVADMPEFLRELVTVKYFSSFDKIDQQLVSKGIISGNMGNFLRAATNFIHQNLVHVDANIYTIENIEDSLCRHLDLTTQVCEAFSKKFHPEYHNTDEYLEIRKKFLDSINKLDTGHIENDSKRKNVLFQAMNFVHHTLKTNFYRNNFTSLSFRLNPDYLNEIPFDRESKFPEIPYGIFFTKGMDFFAYHVRFKDLARGGLRTVYPEQSEQMIYERNNVFTECYNLAYTQQKKNKDIPEGGAKCVIFLTPYETLESDLIVLKNELEYAQIPPQEISNRIAKFRDEQKLESLYQSQRSFIESLITIINCDSDGTLRAKHIVDYWKRPEYLYLGPDENMHDVMIQWISEFSKKYDYKPGSSFISSKPKLGINHKEYGVTSLGVNVYMDAVLRYLGINPEKDPFTIKMTGGPDGDVAGNQLLNLYRYYPNTAKLLALTDGSGTIYEPKGLDLKILLELFHEGKPIRFYPPENLTEGGFLVNKQMRRNPSPLVQQTLCWRKQKDRLIEDWLSGNEMNYLLRHNVHQTQTDIFIPAGGRPRTLHESNVKEFLDETGKPTSKAIIEGANLYLTQKARRFLEKLDVLIIKDSSANKCGVICSSFEVLSGLTLGDRRFMENKEKLVKEILERLRLCASNEAQLLLNTHQETGKFLTDISEEISSRINLFTYQLLDHLDQHSLPSDAQDKLVKAFLDYCLPTLRKEFQEDLLKEIPEHHKKACISCHIGAQLVYKNGLNWLPSIVDILPLLLKNVS